jgi:hypothetical protein
MHRPFVTTVKFENAAGGVMRLDYAVAAMDTTDAKTELERRFLDLEIDGFTIERIVGGHRAVRTDAQTASALRNAACLIKV